MSCGIPITDPDGDKIVITGGYGGLTTVAVYGTEGFITDLEPLSPGRNFHGCSSYLSGGKRVKITFFPRVSTK